MAVHRFSVGCPCCLTGCVCKSCVVDPITQTVNLTIGYPGSTAIPTVPPVSDCYCASTTETYRLSNAPTVEGPATVPFDKWNWRYGFVPPGYVPPYTAKSYCNWGGVTLRPRVTGSTYTLPDRVCGHTNPLSLSSTTEAWDFDTHNYWVLCIEDRVWLHHWFGRQYIVYLGGGGYHVGYKWFYTLREGTLDSCDPLLVSFPALPDGWAVRSQYRYDYETTPESFTDFNGWWFEGACAIPGNASCGGPFVKCQGTVSDARTWTYPFGEISFSLTN